MNLYQIASLPLAGGEIGISPMPGRWSTLASDINRIIAWGADMILTLNPMDELDHVGVGDLGSQIEAADMRWHHFPIRDMGAPSAEVEARWHATSDAAHNVLRSGGRVLTHCYAGCGRSGMAVLRLMVEAGEEPEAALARLRSVRPCAVERDAQFVWAAAGVALRDPAP